MAFSNVFRKALNAVGPLRDPYQEAIDWARANPDFDCGQTVVVYEHSEQRGFVCYARIIRHKWSHTFETWIFTVRTKHGDTFDAAPNRLRLAASDECRYLWTTIRRQS